MARVISRRPKLKKEEEEFLEMYKDVMLNQEDKIIITRKLQVLNQAIQKFNVELRAFDAVLRKHNVTVDASILNFCEILSKLAFTDYNALKNSTVYLQIMQTCLALKRIFKSEIETLAYGDNLIIEPFTFSTFNLKHVFMYVDDTKIAHSIAQQLKKIYTDTCNIFIEEVFEPPIDASKMGKVINDALKILRTKIPKCDQAFDIIQRAVSQFESNYTTYYKESVVTGNNMGVMRSFISDIMESPEVKASKRRASLMLQFRTILKYLNDNYIDTLKKDPKTHTLISLVKKFQDF